MQTYDTIVIGGGPAGYVAAIRCAQLGLRTACVDNWRNPEGEPSLGGTCLNVGCIPSKALLESSAQYDQIVKHLPEHGITAANVRVDVATMQARKSKIVTVLTRGIAGLFKKNKVEWLQGTGRLAPDRKVEIHGAEGSPPQLVEASHIIIATGSVPAELAEAPFDGRYILDSAGALALEAVPPRLGIIGAGVIGLELGSVWARLGASVTILEAMDNFLPAADTQIAREAFKQLKAQGLDIRLGAHVKQAGIDGQAVSVDYEDAAGGHRLQVDKLVVAVGRRPNTAGLAPEAVGLALDERGRIVVDGQCRTSVDGIYAIGDVVRGPMLAHKGSEEGVAAAETIAGMAGHVSYDTIPWVIYTEPEIAWVGRSEQDLRAEGVPCRIGSFPFRASGRALGSGHTAGLVKIVGHAQTDRILGVHIIGQHASELIAEAVTAMEFAASTEDLARIVHAHPTLSEALHEAALAVDERAIHL